MTRQEKEQHLKHDLRLIYSLALKYYRECYLEKEDAIQYSAMEYWKGLDVWDPSRGALTTFMTIRIPQRLRIYGWRDRMIRGRGMKYKQPSVISEEDVLGGIESNVDTPEEAYMKYIYPKEIIDRALQSFSDRDKELIYGLMCGDTMEEWAEKIGVSSQRVSQIYMRFKSKVRILDGGQDE